MAADDDGGTPHAHARRARGQARLFALSETDLSAPALQAPHVILIRPDLRQSYLVWICFPLISWVDVGLTGTYPHPEDSFYYPHMLLIKLK